MVAKNEITGDLIKTKGLYSKQGEESFDSIFRNPSNDSVSNNNQSHTDSECHTPLVTVSKKLFGTRYTYHQ